MSGKAVDYLIILKIRKNQEQLLLKTENLDFFYNDQEMVRNYYFDIIFTK